MNLSPVHRSGGHWVFAALVVGIAAAAVELCYLFHIRPFQADLGIQVSGGLLLGWFILVLVAFGRKARGAWFTLLPAPVALIGPGLLALLAAGCSLNAASCP
jgi:hypothetical protein